MNCPSGSVKPLLVSPLLLPPLPLPWMAAEPASVLLLLMLLTLPWMASERKLVRVLICWRGKKRQPNDQRNATAPLTCTIRKQTNTRL